MMNPAMVIGTVEMVSVEWIMKNLHYSVDGFSHRDGTLDFRYMLLEKALDHDFHNLVGAIMSEGFRVPIVIDLGYLEHKFTMGNGHHRLSAAILLCLAEIPVFWADNDYMSNGVSDTEEVGHYPEWEGLQDMLSEGFYA